MINFLIFEAKEREHVLQNNRIYIYITFTLFNLRLLRLINHKILIFS
jgi:hypothetical protein